MRPFFYSIVNRFFGLVICPLKVFAEAWDELSGSNMKILFTNDDHARLHRGLMVSRVIQPALLDEIRLNQQSRRPLQQRQALFQYPK